jgi:hypothetical protein
VNEFCPFLSQPSPSPTALATNDLLLDWSLSGSSAFFVVQSKSCTLQEIDDISYPVWDASATFVALPTSASFDETVSKEGIVEQQVSNVQAPVVQDKTIKLRVRTPVIYIDNPWCNFFIWTDGAGDAEVDVTLRFEKSSGETQDYSCDTITSSEGIECNFEADEDWFDSVSHEVKVQAMVSGTDIVSEISVVQFDAAISLPSNVFEDSSVWVDISSSPALVGENFETSIRATTVDATIGAFELATWVIELTLSNIAGTNDTTLENSLSFSSIKSNLYDVSFATDGNIVTFVAVQKSSVTDSNMLSSVNYDDETLLLGTITWSVSENAETAGFESLWMDDIVSTATNKVIDDKFGTFVFEGISSTQASVNIEGDSSVGVHAMVDTGSEQEFVNFAVLGAYVASSTVQVQSISKCHPLASSGSCQEVAILEELDTQGSLTCESFVPQALNAALSSTMACVVSVSGDETLGGDVTVDIVYESPTGEKYASTVTFRVWFPLFVKVSVDDSELNQVVTTDGIQLDPPFYQSTKALVTGKLGVGYDMTTPRVDLTGFVVLSSTDESILMIDGSSVTGVGEGSATLTCNFCSIYIDYETISVSMDSVTVDMTANAITGFSAFLIGDFVDRNAEREASGKEATKPFFKAESTVTVQQKFTAEGDIGYIFIYLDYSDGNQFALVDHTNVDIVVEEDRADLTVVEDSNPIELVVPLNGESADGKYGTLTLTIDGIQFAETDISVTVELPEVDYIELSASDAVIYPALDTMAKYPFNMPTTTVLTTIVYYVDGSFRDYSTDERTVYSANSDVIAEDAENHGTFYVAAEKYSDDVYQESITIAVNCFGASATVEIATDIAFGLQVQAQAFPNCQLSGCVPKDTVHTIQSSDGEYERLQLFAKVITALGNLHDLSMDFVVSKYDTRDITVLEDSRLRRLGGESTSTTSSSGLGGSTTSSSGLGGVETTSDVEAAGTTAEYPAPSPFDSACEEMENNDECDFTGDLERFSFTFTENADESTSIVTTYREFLVELDIYKDTDVIVVPTAFDITSPSDEISTPQTIFAYVTLSDETGFSTNEAFYDPKNYIDFSIDDSLIVSVDADGILTPLSNSLSQETVTVTVTDKDNTVFDTTNIYVNLGPEIGDLDIGSKSGFQFESFDDVSIGSTIDVPVRFNSGSQPLAGFQIQIFFDSSIIQAISVQNGADWTPSVTPTLNSPSTMVQILSSAPDSETSGTDIEIAVITFEVVGSGSTSITGTILESLTSDGVHIGDDDRDVVAGAGIVSIQGRRRLSHEERQFLLTAPYTARAQPLSRQRRSLFDCTVDDDTTCLRGDANADCAFSLSDLDFLIRYMTGVTLDFDDEDYQMNMMDVDIDGDIDGVDVTFMLYTLAKKYVFLKDLPTINTDGCSVSISMSFCTDMSELVQDASSTLIMVEVGSVDGAYVNVTSAQTGIYKQNTEDGYLYIAAGPDESSSSTGTTFDLSLQMSGAGEVYDLGFVLLAETLTDNGISDDARKFPWRGSSYGYFGEAGFTFDPIVSVSYGCECDSTCSSPGYFKSGCGSGSPACTLCTSADIGVYPVTNGVNEDICEFELCPAGYKCDFPNLMTPVPCDAGTYQDSEGQTQCISCDDGSYQPDIAQNQCIPCADDCDVGYFTGNCSGTHAGECAPCTPSLGYFFVDSGGWNDECAVEEVPQDCLVGQYSTTDDFLTYSCTDCDPIADGFYYTDQGGFFHVCPTEACFVGCDIGFYNEGCGGTNSGACTECDPAETGYYIVGDGDLDRICTVDECPVSTCEMGQYLSGCEGTNTGVCEDCTDPDDGYFTSNGGLDDSCGQELCVDCPMGEYLSGCFGTSSGECQPCTNDDGYYIVESAGLREDVCEMVACADDCDVGFYRTGCEGTNEGICTACSNPPAGYVIVGNGGLEDACEITSCSTDCRVGEYNKDCGNMDHPEGTCVACSDPPPGYYFIDDGGISDACAVKACDADECNNGQFLSGCDGTSPGTCVSCTSLELGQYWVLSGGLRDACESQDCEATCGIGEYLSNCEGATSAGECAPCTNAPPGAIYETDGGLANACEFVQCEPVCPVGEYLESCTSDENVCTTCTTSGSTECMANGGDSDKLFNYEPESTNKEIALLACESENGFGNCEYGVCGGYEYFYKFTDGDCDCGKAVGTVEWVFSNNLGYDFVDQDYRQQGGEEEPTVNGDDLFTRIRTKDTCTGSVSWEVLELHLGVATSQESQDCGSFYYTDSGGFDDACPTNLCNNNCPVNQYNFGCEGTNPGECVDCSPISDGYHYYDDGNLADACLSAKCIDECPAGYYLDECYIGPGSCVSCSAPETGFYLSSNGNQEDACTSTECATSCPAGSYMSGECGGDDGAQNYECIECLSCGIEFIATSTCDGTTFEDVTICELPSGEPDSRGEFNIFDYENSSTILFGANNTAIGDNLFIGNGLRNRLYSLENGAGGSSVILSGNDNELAGGYSSIFGGSINAAGYSDYSALVGGANGKLGTDPDEEHGYNAILAGGKNGLNEGRNGFVGGGFKCKVTDAADESSVGGGQKNSVGNDQSVAMAGKNGKSVSNWCTVVGGYLTKANGRWATTLGGSKNTASGKKATAGGFQSRAASDRSLVMGFDSSKYCRSLGDSTINFCVSDGYYINDMELSEMVEEANTGRRHLSTANSIEDDVKLLRNKLQHQQRQILQRQAQVEKLKLHLAYVNAVKQKHLL